MAVSILLLMMGSCRAKDFEVTLDHTTINQNGNFFGDGWPTDVTQKAPGSSFEGNISSSQHFALLSAQPGSLLVGGRGVVYNLSLPGLHEIREEVGKHFHSSSSCVDKWKEWEQERRSTEKSVNVNMLHLLLVNSVFEE